MYMIICVIFLCVIVIWLVRIKIYIYHGTMYSHAISTKFRQHFSMDYPYPTISVITCLYDVIIFSPDQYMN